MSESTSQGASGANFDLSQFYQVFFEEAGENLANMERLLLEIDADEPDNESLNAIFRCAHSIKGGAATFGFQDVADLTHVMETLLDRLRRNELTINAGMVDVLLESGDVLRVLLGGHQGSRQDKFDASELVARIRAHADGSAAAVPLTPAAAAVACAAAPAATPAWELQVGPLERADTADQLVELFKEISGLGTIEPMDDGRCDAQGMRRFKVVTTSSTDDLLDLFTFHVSRDKVVFKPLQQDAPAVATVAPQAVPAPAPVPAGDEGFGFFVDIDAQKAQAKAAAPQAAAAAAGGQDVSKPAATKPAARADKGGSNLESSTLRVSVEKVDQLINLVGELVITQAMLAQNGNQLDPIVHQSMLGSLADLERNTRSLQESVMAIRMIPMAVVFNRFPRMLRDLASKLGKRVELNTIGEATELDKGMIEKITDPLTHLVRNAVDHGIEMPEVRTAAGKSAEGTITLSAEHRGGSIVIEVRDDGRGLSREKLLAKAQERGLEVSDSMSDQEAWQLIFEPGFSTASEVTDVSGRGVGMDVVRRNILSLGGTVELDSAEGYGTRVSVRLPLTLAIMDGMSVGVGDETYIVPLGSVIESIQLEPEEVRSVAGSNRVIRVREEFLPVIPLEEIFNVPRFESNAESDAIMIVIEAEGSRIALLVDRLIGQHQVVVKNLEANYRKVQGIAGATILGDGKVALILDVAALVKHSRH